MKSILATILCLLALSSAQGQHPSRFDEYGRLPIVDEKARLDNLAIHLQNEPDYVAWLVVYAGQKTCIGDARKRAVRSRDHLVIRRGIRANRVMWIDGGYREEPTVGDLGLSSLAWGTICLLNC